MGGITESQRLHDNNAPTLYETSAALQDPKALSSHCLL
jgi:hypothetical protein